MLSFLRIVKLEIGEEATAFERLPERETFEIIEEIEDCQLTVLSLNLFWFLANHIVLRILRCSNGQLTLGIPIPMAEVPDVFHVLELRCNIQNGCKPSPNVDIIRTLKKKR